MTVLESFMKHWLVPLTLVVSLIGPTAAQSTTPNIILFLVDDMGWQDTSVPLGPEPTPWNGLYRTPNMQALAERGVRFTAAYASSPVCSPTRVAIMTGKNPGRTRVSDWVGHGVSTNAELSSPQWATDGLQPGEGVATLPGILSDNGYLTAHIGKAHFGGDGTPGADPTTLGFEINIGGSRAGSPRGRGSQGGYFAPFPPRNHPGLEHHAEGTYITHALTEACLTVIDRALAQERPFFINMAHYAVHTPIRGQGDPELMGHYDDSRPEVEQDYAAMVEAMDSSLGEIMRHLDARDIDDNTVILFASDNGGLSNHTRAVESPPWELDWHNSPAFSGKGSGYDGGMRIPMIVGWAGGNGDEARSGRMPILSGIASDEPVHTDDLMPTILSIAGVQNPVPAEELDGQDLTAILAGRSFDRAGGIFWHYPHQWYRDANKQAGILPFSAARRGDFKILYFYGLDGGVVELFNLSEDPGEQDDLSSNPTHAASLRMMANTLLDWLEKVDAQVPSSKSTGEPVELSALLRAAGR